MKCSKCGSENNEDARFCTFCGNDLGAETQNSGSVNENQGFENNQQKGRENFQGEGFNPYNRQPYNNYNNNYNNFGMMPPADYERENSTAHTLAALSIVIGVISTLFAALSLFVGVNYGAIVAFVLAIGAVVKAKPGCVKGAKTAAVIIAVIALGISAVFTAAGNISFLVENNQEVQDFYDDYYDGFYDDFYNDFGNGSEDDFLGGFDDNVGNGELV